MSLILNGIKQLAVKRNIVLKNVYQIGKRSLSTHKDTSNMPDEQKIGGFAKAFEKFSQPEIKPVEEKQTFASLLRNSKFIDLGDPENKIVTGKIVHVVGDDLYIDFGWKFHCVCTRPTENAEQYVRGANVRLKIKDLELSTKFLGAEKDLTLLEADAILLGLVEK